MTVLALVPAPAVELPPGVPTFVTTEQLAAILQVHIETLRAYARDPKWQGPSPLRVGRSLRWNLYETLDYFKS